jgi:protein-L-isoaspartate(D-aspartate) O-methyltransferase
MKYITSYGVLRKLKLLLFISMLDTYYDENAPRLESADYPKPSPKLFLYTPLFMRVLPNEYLAIKDIGATGKSAQPAGINVKGFLGESHISLRASANMLQIAGTQNFLEVRNLLSLLVKENTMSMPQSDFITQRANMIESQLKKLGIRDTHVLEAMNRVPRHLFVPDELKEQAYTDSPLPIGYGQTISQPYIVALMCEVAAIQPHDKVLEIGAGSGYQAAVLSQLAQKVYTIEIVPNLGKQAREILKKLEYNNVQVKIGDGYSGWVEHAPYNAIFITAASEEVPQPLIDQLADKGRLIAPLGKGLRQELIRFTKTKRGLKKESFGAVVFVPFQRESERKEQSKSH